MIEQVNSLIRNKLSQNESIYLPHIGSLIFSHVGAKRLSSKQIATPHNKITFSGEERGESLVAIIATIAGIPIERADSIYEQWLQQASKGGVVTISGVGTIENRQFKPDGEFANLMNLVPKTDVVKVKPKVNYIFYAIASISVLFAIGSTYYIIVSEKEFSQRMDKQSVTQRDITAMQERPATSEKPRITATVSTEPREESQPVQTEQVTVSQPEPIVTEGAGDMIANESYAVWGVYSELPNAERYAKWLKNNYTELPSGIYNYKGRYMVAIYSGSSRKEVAVKVQALKSSDDRFADVWIYTNK